MKTNRLLYCLIGVLLCFPASLLAQQNAKEREKPAPQEIYEGFNDAELEIETDKIRERRRRSVRILISGVQVFAGGVVTLIVGALTSDQGDQLNRDVSTVMYVVGGVTMGVGAALSIGGGVGIGVNNNKLKAIDEERLRRANAANGTAQNRTSSLSFVLSPIFVGVNFSM